MDEWVWSNGGMILTEKTEVMGHKPLPVSICTKQILSHCRGNKPSSPQIKPTRTLTRSAIILHRIFSLSTSVLTAVMKGLTSRLIKWMFKRCLPPMHTQTLCRNACYRNPPRRATPPHKILSTKLKHKKHRTANKLHVMFTAVTIHHHVMFTAVTIH
jgi:hypothetical protein